MTPIDNTHEDARLVNAIRAGDRDAFEPLLLRYYPSILRLCQRLLGATGEAYDVAQEAALHAFLGLDQLQEPARFGAWLHAIAANTARKAMRRRYLLPLDTLDQPEHQLEHWSQYAPTLEDVYAQRELRAAFTTALQELSPPNRAAVVGFFVEGYSYSELAERFDVPVSTVRGRLFQGRQHLKRALRPFRQERQALPDQQKDMVMNTPTMMEMKLLGFCSAPFERELLVLLRAVETKRDVPLRLSRADTDALQDMYATTPDQPARPSLTQRIMNTLQAQLQRVTIHRLADTAFYVTLQLIHNNQTIELDAPLGEALVLALRNGTPIYMAQPVLDALSIEIAPLIEQWQHDTSFRREWKQRMRERVYGSEATPRRVREMLTPDGEQRIVACLVRVLQEVEGTLVLLVHQRGRLVAWHGDGDAETIELFCGVRMVYEEDLRGIRDLLVYHTLLVSSVWPADGLVTMQDVGDEWRLELGWTQQRSHDTWEQDRKYLQLAARELEDLLPDVIVTDNNHIAED